MQLWCGGSAADIAPSTHPTTLRGGTDALAQTLQRGSDSWHGAQRRAIHGAGERMMCIRPALQAAAAEDVAARRHDRLVAQKCADGAVKLSAKINSKVPSERIDVMSWGQTCL
jgi:hypothetical protein